MAPVSTDDADAKLAARIADEKADAARAAIAATQPSGLTNGDLDRMQK